jgi:hypothetical protein
LIKKIMFFVFILFFIMGCSEEKGKLRIWLTDAPPPQDVQHIYFTILGVGIRDEEGVATTIQNDIHQVDVIELAGGYAAPLTYDYFTGSSFIDVESGNYRSVLLWFAQVNSVVRSDTVIDSLLIPEEYYPFSSELEEEFTILPGESRTIVIDFDASKSINWDGPPYELIPSFRIFQSSNAGFITGTVKTIEDTSEVAVKYAALQAVSSTDSITTLSDSAGNYSFFIPEGTYDVSVLAEGYTSDTIYRGLVVVRDSLLDSCNFTLE